VEVLVSTYCLVQGSNDVNIEQVYDVNIAFDVNNWPLFYVYLFEIPVGYDGVE
jgi:hypothetical protein